MNALLRIAAWILAVALVVAPGAAVLNGWVAGERFPMRQLVVTGEFRQVSDARVRSVVMPYVRNGFFAVDLDAMRAALAELPWVRSVEVRKRWPDRLEVALVEYKPLARWGEDRMLSENGEIFPAPKGHVSRVEHFQGAEDSDAGAHDIQRAFDERVGFRPLRFAALAIGGVDDEFAAVLGEDCDRPVARLQRIAHPLQVGGAEAIRLRRRAQGGPDVRGEQVCGRRERADDDAEVARQLLALQGNGEAAAAEGMEIARPFCGAEDEAAALAFLAVLVPHRLADLVAAQADKVGGLAVEQAGERGIDREIAHLAIL